MSATLSIGYFAEHGNPMPQQGVRESAQPNWPMPGTERCQSLRPTWEGSWGVRVGRPIIQCGQPVASSLCWRILVPRLIKPRSWYRTEMDQLVGPTVN